MALKFSLQLTADNRDLIAGVGQSRDAIGNLVSTVDKNTPAMQRLADKSDIAAAAAERMSESYKRAATSIVMGGAANSNAKAIDSLTAGAAKGTSLAAHEVTNLTRQFSDLGVMLGTGQSPFMAMITQGPQIADIMGQRGIRGALGGVVTGLASMASPTMIALAALTALGYGASYVFEAIRGDIKSVDDVLAEQEAFIKRVGDAYPEAAEKAKAYGRDSIAVLRAIGAQQVEQQEKALRASVGGFAGDYDAFINPQTRDDARLLYKEYEPFAGVLEQLGEEAKKARPDIAAIREQIAAIRNEPGASSAVQKIADEMLAASEEAEALAQTLPATEKVISVLGDTSAKSAEQLKAISNEVEGLVSAMGRLAESGKPALSPFEKIEKDYQAVIKSPFLDARDRQEAERLRRQAIEREETSRLPVPKLRGVDDVADNARDFIRTQDEMIERIKLEMQLTGVGHGLRNTILPEGFE